MYPHYNLRSLHVLHNTEVYYRFPLWSPPMKGFKFISHTLEIKLKRLLKTLFKFQIINWRNGG